MSGLRMPGGDDDFGAKPPQKPGAIADLEKLPIQYLGDMQRMQVSPGDVFVLRMKGPMSMDTAQRIKQYWESQIPSNKLIVLTDDISVGVIAISELAAHGLKPTD